MHAVKMTPAIFTNSSTEPETISRHTTKHLAFRSLTDKLFALKTQEGDTKFKYEPPKLNPNEIFVKFKAQGTKCKLSIVYEETYPQHKDAQEWACKWTSEEDGTEGFVSFERDLQVLVGNDETIEIPKGQVFATYQQAHYAILTDQKSRKNVEYSIYRVS